MSAFYKLVNSPLKFRLFLLRKLPSAYFAGLRIESCTEEKCVVSVPFKWFTQNPFRSTYFACLSMAAEMSTGVLAMAHVYGRKPSVSMLVVSMHSSFHKKAKGKTVFICEEGKAIQQAISTACSGGGPQTITVISKGYNKQNELVAEFCFTWSFKAKQQ